MSAAIWCPERKGYVGDELMAGGGKFGPQYAYSHRQSDHYRGSLPFTEFIEVAVATPVYIFGIVIGMPRGVGSIVAIRARNPLAEEGSDGEWVRMYEANPLLEQDRKNRAVGGPYWNWAPNVCRTHFLADTIRIEVDTSDETGVGDWNYIDAVEIFGSTSIQEGALRQEADITGDIGKTDAWVTEGTTVTRNVKVVFVPHTNAHGEDSFEYKATDCTGDMFRISEPGLVSIIIDDVNDAPSIVIDAVGVTTNKDEQLNFSALVADVETAPSQLVIEITGLPPGTASRFYDGPTLVSPSALPHRLANALNVLSFRFDSLVGLESFQVPDGELQRTAATAHVSFTATDPHGGTTASIVQLQFTTATLSCVADDHEVIYEGELPVCSACAPGRAARPGSPGCNICAEGYFRLTVADDASSCAACPLFAVHCPRDATLATMELSAGWWRASNRSAELHWCGEAPGRVRFRLLNWLEGNSAGPVNLSSAAARAICRGGAFPSVDGRGADGSCAPNHLGPLCRSCDPSYYLDGNTHCTVCPEGGSIAVLISCVIVTGLVAVVGFRLLFWYHTRPMLASAGVVPQCADACLRVLSKQVHHLNKMRANNVLVPTLKLIISYSQVVSAIPNAFDLDMPDSYYRALGWLDVFTLQWLLELGFDPACVGNGDLATRTTIFGFTPLGIIVLLPFVASGFNLLAIVAVRALPLSCFPASHGEKVSIKDRLYRSFVRMLPLSVCIAFISVTSVTSKIFAAFDCLTIETDSISDTKASRDFVSTDLTLQCDTSVAEYHQLLNLAYILLLLWPVAMPLAFGVLLFSMRRKLLHRRGSQLTRATSFLHKEYEAEYFFWEPLVLMQRLALIGWVQLVPRDKQLLRIIVGLLVSLMYTLLLMIYKPYFSFLVDTLAIISQGSLVLVFISALLLKTFDLTKPAGIEVEVTGFSSEDTIALFAIVATLSILVTVTLAALHEVHKQSNVKVLLCTKNNQQPTLELGKRMSYHLFLSHAWSSAQDTSAVIKHMLRWLLPGVSVFLDVDDLEEIGNLEAYVNSSQCILVMLTQGYFTSRNCLREFNQSLATNKPLVLVNEGDLSKGGAPLSVLRLEFERHEQQKRGFIVGERCRHEKRGLGTVKAYDGESGMVKLEFDDPPGDLHTCKPSSQYRLHLLKTNGLSQAAKVFERDDIIMWQRVAEFQAISLRLIAEQLLRATPVYSRQPLFASSLYIPNAIDCQDLQLPPGTRVYVSVHNPGASQLARELEIRLLLSGSNLLVNTISKLAASAKSLTARAGMSNGTLGVKLQAKVEAAAESKASSKPLSQEAASIRVQSHYRGHKSRRRSRLRTRIMTTFTTDASEFDPVDAVGLDSQRRWSIAKGMVAKGMVAKGVGPPITHMLLVLNKSTFQGDAGDELFDEVAKARTNGVEVVMAHECDVQRGGCNFVQFFETTPQKLISDGLFDKIAIACHAEPYRQMSMSLIAKALGAKSGRRKKARRQTVKDTEIGFNAV